MIKIQSNFACSVVAAQATFETCAQYFFIWQALMNWNLCSMFLNHHMLFNLTCFNENYIFNGHVIPIGSPCLGCLSINSSPPGQNGCHFADNIFICIFVNEQICILIHIPLKFLPKDLIDNKSTLVQVMAWCRTGDKPLPEPMLPSSLTHIRSSRSRWVQLMVGCFSNKQ